MYDDSITVSDGGAAISLGSVNYDPITSSEPHYMAYYSSWLAVLHFDIFSVSIHNSLTIISPW